MSKYCLHNQLNALPGKGAHLVSILIRASHLVKKEHKCLLYMVSQSSDDLDSIWITEVWNSKVEQEDSLLNSTVRALISEAIPLLASPPQRGEALNVVSGI